MGDGRSERITSRIVAVAVVAEYRETRRSWPTTRLFSRNLEGSLLEVESFIVEAAFPVIRKSELGSRLTFTARQFYLTLPLISEIATMRMVITILLSFYILHLKWSSLSDIS